MFLFMSKWIPCWCHLANNDGISLCLVVPVLTPTAPQCWQFSWFWFIPVHVNYICFSDDSTQLTLKEIQNELKETASKWYQLGVQLEIPSAMLSTIESDHPSDVQRCMTEVLDWWLRNAPERSWEKLTEALEAMGGYRVLVEKLRKHPKVSITICVTQSCLPMLT